MERLGLNKELAESTHNMCGKEELTASFYSKKYENNTTPLC